MSNLTLNIREIGPWVIQAIELSSRERTMLLPIFGTIGNSVPTSERGKDITRNWKIQVASEVMAERGRIPWKAQDKFGITIGFSFHVPSHGGRPLDVENFLKPTIDALAAGLFCSSEVNPQQIVKFNYDDSNFNTLLIHRLDDARDPASEGIALVVSTRRQ